jgi:membrane protease YdiL (CAAX protease family)
MRPAQLAALAAFACLALLAAAGRLRFLREEFQDRPRRALAALLLFGVLTACVFYPAVSPDQAASIDPSALWFPMLFFGHAVLAAFLFLWRHLRSDISWGRFLHLNRLVASDIRRGLWTGCMGWMATILVTAAVAFSLRTSGLPGHSPEVPEFMFWIAHLGLERKLIVILIAMTVEEAFFRGFLQPRVGWIPASLLFVLGHASYGLPLMLVGVTVISLVLGWSFRRTGRLLPCVIAHGTFDAIQLLVIIPWAVGMIEREALPLLVSGSWFPVCG